MIIDRVEITYVSMEDGLPIKNKLPGDLKDRLKTENQWMEEGFVLKEKAAGYEMHPSVLSKRTFLYYLDSDVAVIDKKTMGKCCGTCGFRSGRFCEIAGDYVKMSGCCSEWE